MDLTDLSAWLAPQGPLFLVALLAAALGYWLVVPRPWRDGFLLLLSLVHAALLLGWKLLFILLPVGLAHHQARQFERTGRSQLRPALVFLLGLFVLFKGAMLLRLVAQDPTFAGAFVPVAPLGESGLLLPMGLSYALFRLIHYLVEVHRGRLRAGTLPDLGLFVLWFPTLRAGPIHRLPGFGRSPHLTQDDLNQALFRLLSGLVKKVGAADLLLVGMAAPWLASLDLPYPLRWLLFGYLLTLIVYMDFSGYSDLAIGSSRLFGVVIPENFHYPLTSSNIADFWRNWHITLYTFIRDYFFLPFFARSSSLRKVMLGLFLSFVASQIWHAFTLNFLLLGVYHGLLMALWAGFERFRRSRAWARPKGRIARAGGVVLTFHLVALGFLLFFWGRLPGISGAHWR